MVKITVLCDRCGQEVNGKVGYIAWNFRDGVDGDLMLDNEFENRHYCQECMGRIKSFMLQGPEKEPGGTELKPMPKPVAAGQKKVKRIDIGKILALKDAGWGIAEIANEMGLMPSSVSNALYHYKKKQTEGNGGVEA